MEHICEATHDTSGCNCNTLQSWMPEQAPAWGLLHEPQNGCALHTASGCRIDQPKQKPNGSAQECLCSWILDCVFACILVHPKRRNFIIKSGVHHITLHSPPQKEWAPWKAMCSQLCASSAIGQDSQPPVQQAQMHAFSKAVDDAKPMQVQHTCHQKTSTKPIWGSTLTVRFQLLTWLDRDRHPSPSGSSSLPISTSLACR